MKPEIKRWIGAACLPWTRLAKRPGNRTLIYHAFGSRLEHDSYGISMPPSVFRAQIDWIRSRYDVTPLTSVQELEDSKGISVTITIDDGYEDTMRAADILTAYNVPFTVFVTSGMIGRPQYLKKNQLMELSKIHNCRIGAHGVGHLKLGELSPERQAVEICESKAAIEDIIQKNVTRMSLPHGSYNEATLDIIDSAGYVQNFSSRVGPNTSANYHPFLIKRSEVISTDTIRELERKITGYYDYLAYVHMFRRIVGI